VQVKQKNIMFAILAVVMVGLVWNMFIYKPMGSKVSKANQAAQEAETREQKLQGELDRLQGGGKDKKAKDASLESLQTAMPKDPQLAEFLVAFDNIKADTGVAFQAIAPSPPVAGIGNSSINLAITVQGSHGQVMDYVDRVSKLSRLVIVDNVTETAGAAANGPGGEATGGGPTGDVFAGQGAAPMMQVQLTARIFTQAMAVTDATGSAAGAGATTQRPAASGASS
jgi:type IV pilus assembly protein PilO